MWIRWSAHANACMPIEDVAAVLEISTSADVAGFVAYVPRRGARPAAGRPGRLAVGELGRVLRSLPDGRKVRILRKLGYQPTPIAGILGLPVADVKRFLRRLEPVRKAELARPRERSEERRLRATRPLPPRVRNGDGY